MGALKSQINNFFWYGPQRYEVKLPMHHTSHIFQIGSNEFTQVLT